MRIALGVTVLIAIGTQAQTAKDDGWRKLKIPKWWQFLALVAGNHPHEHYASGSSSGSGGVYRTLDGDKTWSNFSRGLDQSLCHNNVCVTRITISPVDGSKYLLVGGYQLWYHR